MGKFNIKRDYVVDLEIFCTTSITKKLYEKTNNSSDDRSLVTLSSKIKYVERIFEYLDKFDEEFSRLNYVASTIVFDDYYKMHQ